MILKEWMDSVEFDRLVAPLVKFDPEAGRNLVDYKMAFDRLRRMSPGTDDGDVIALEMLGHDDGTGGCLEMCETSSVRWEVELARKVVVKEDVRASGEEIVAAMLWGLTFYGFSPEQIQGTFREWEDEYVGYLKENPYVGFHRRLNQAHHDHHCRYKEDVGTRCYSHKNRSDWCWRKPAYGRKRHRERRQTARLEYLEKMMRRWDLWRRFALSYCARDWGWESFEKMAAIRRMQLETVCPRGEEAPYLSDLLHYVRLDAAACKRTIIGIRYAPGVGVGNLRLAVLKSPVFPNPQFYMVAESSTDHVKMDALLLEIRISPKDNKKLEASHNYGRTWDLRCIAKSSRGSFIDLVEEGDEILVTSEKGLFFSKNGVAHGICAIVNPLIH